MAGPEWPTGMHSKHMLGLANEQMLPLRPQFMTTDWSSDLQVPAGAFSVLD